MSAGLELPTPGSRPGFELRSLPPAFRGANALARSLGSTRPRLDPETLTRAASRRAGLRPAFPAHVGEALEVLCRSLRDDAGLHWFGRANVQNLIVTGLAEQLRLEARFEAEPELDATELIPPLIVTGLPRSGTTFLHRLLSAPGGTMGVPLHRHLFPTRRSELGSRLEAELLFKPWQRASHSYGLDAIHFVRPGLPDECNFGMRLSLRSMIFWATAPTYAYLRWLLDQDLRETYRLYRRALLLHQARNPGRRLVLKCPHHLAWLPALAEAIPEALIVQTHREPRQIVPSEIKLILSLHGLGSGSLDWRKTAEHNRLKVLTFARRSVAFAASEAGAGVCHVDYRRLVADPIATARDIHAHFGLAHGPEEVAALTQYFGANHQHKHGKNRYSLAEFDLDLGAIERDFGDYRARFLSATIPT